MMSGHTWHAPKIVVAAVFIAAGFLVYANSLHNGFVYDDTSHIVKNTAITSVSNIPAIFTHDLTYFGGSREGRFYRPLETLSFMANYRAGGLDPFGYHAVNTALHILVAILFFYLLCLITGDTVIAAVAGLIYLVHPAHTEAVAYVSGRADSIAAIFFLAMAILQRRSWSAAGAGKAIAYAGMLVSFALALLAKESAVIFPFLLIFFGYCLKRDGGYGRVCRNAVLYYLPFFLIMAAWFIIRNGIVPAEAMVMTQASLPTRLIAAARAIFDYLRVSFVPAGLHMEYRYPYPKSLFQAGYIGPFVLVVLLLPCVYALWRKGRSDAGARIIFLGAGWFLIALLPYLNIFFQLNAPFAEHWLYIPGMGLTLSVVYAAFHLARGSKAARGAVIGIFLIVSAVFATATIRQNAVWRDNITFYEYTLRHAPYSAQIYNNLAVEYIRKGDLKAALRLLVRAIEIDPRYQMAVENLRTLKRQMGLQ